MRSTRDSSVTPELLPPGSLPLGNWIKVAATCTLVCFLPSLSSDLLVALEDRNAGDDSSALTNPLTVKLIGLE